MLLLTELGKGSPIAVGAREVCFFCCYLQRINLKDTVRNYRGHGLGNHFVMKGHDGGYIFDLGYGFGGNGDGLIGRGLGTFVIKGFNYASQASWVTFAGARFNALGSTFVCLTRQCCGRFVRLIRVCVQCVFSLFATL